MSRQNHGLLQIDPIVPGGYYRRRRPVSVDTTDLIPQEAIFKTYISSLVQGYGPICRFVLQDALVAGPGSLITRGGGLLEESCWEFLARGQVPYGLMREDAESFRITTCPTEVVRTPSLLLKRPWWPNYGHWLVDAGVLLGLVIKHRMVGFEQVVVGSTEDPKLRAIIRETLACIAPDIRVVEHPDAALWMFTELHYVQPIRRPPMFTLPSAIEALRVAVLGEPPPPTGDRRLFVSRRNFGRRRLSNEPEIIDVCQRHGFEVAYPEHFSLREQAALFRSASAVVGVKGAALANIIFSPPDTSLIALSPGDFADPFFWDIAGARGLAYFEIFGSLVSEDEDDGQAQNLFAISPGRLDALIREALPVR